MLAHRTSPTNIGLYLLSTLAARDFGWLGTLDAVEKIEATLATMGRLESFHGHLLNWYDTSNLKPLDPKYVSSVDSGNLAGDLLVLASSCRDLIPKTTIDGRMLAGLQDSISLLRETLASSPDNGRGQTVTRKHLSNAIEALANSPRLGTCQYHGVGFEVRGATRGAAPRL